MSFQPDPYTTPQHQHSHYQHQQYRSHLTVPTVQIDPLQHIKQQPQPEAREINLNPPPGDPGHTPYHRNVNTSVTSPSQQASSPNSHWRYPSTAEPTPNELPPNVQLVKRTWHSKTSATAGAQNKFMCLTSCCLPCVEAWKMRKDLLQHDPYTCCNTAYDCRYSNKSVHLPDTCMSCELCCCLPCFIVGNRYSMLNQYHLTENADDLCMQIVWQTGCMCCTVEEIRDQYFAPGIDPQNETNHCLRQMIAYFGCVLCGPCAIGCVQSQLRQQWNYHQRIHQAPEEQVMT